MPFPSIRTNIHEAAASVCDEDLYAAFASYIRSLRFAHAADRLSPDDIKIAEQELDIAEDVANSIAGDDPPWYKILYPSLRADLLALSPDRLPDAISFAKTALERARARWSDPVPQIARQLVGLLLKANHLDEARDALAMAIPEAEAERHLRELARLQAYSIVLLVRTHAPTEDVQKQITKFEKYSTRPMPRASPPRR